MKKFLSFTVLMALAFTSSCSNFLDIRPVLDLSDKDALISTNGLQSALVGAYSGLASGAVWGGNVIGVGELWADHVESDVGANFGLLQIINRQMNFFNPEGRSMWQTSYSTINRVNNILDAMPTINDKDISTNKDRIKGECLFIRGALHFTLVRYFAQPWGFTNDNSHDGIIIKLVPARGAEGSVIPRNKVSEVYAQVIKDLTEAESLLPSTNDNRATKSAAAALLARVYFSQGDMTNASQAASRAISNNSFSLNDDVANIYTTPNSSESIFEMQSTALTPVAGALNGYFRQEDNDPPFWVSAAFEAILFKDASRTNDKRRKLYNQRDGRIFVKKYDQVDPPINAIIFRLAELYLIRAEATAQSNAASALSDLNKIRQRAGLAALSGLTGDALIKAIREERTIELAFEGDRFFELKRIKQTIRSRAWNDPQHIFKLPDVEINANTAARQNPD